MRQMDRFGRDDNREINHFSYLIERRKKQQLGYSAACEGISHKTQLFISTMLLCVFTCDALLPLIGTQILLSCYSVLYLAHML